MDFGQAPLGEVLGQSEAARLAGVVRVTGQPGGTIYLADGAVTAIQTPGAPSAEVILLRSRLVTESSWDEAFTAAAKAGTPMGTELVARDVLGAGELEALLRTVLADAMFVLASGQIEDCRPVAGPADYLLPLKPGARSGLLLAEASRRVDVLAAMRCPPGSERVVAGARRVTLGPGRDEILALADGRRTARDIAFALGRGVYATMVDIAELLESGVLATVPQRGAGAGQPADGAQVGSSSATADEPETAAGLPLRRKGQPRRAGGPGPSGDVPGLQRLLRPRTVKNADPGDDA